MKISLILPPQTFNSNEVCLKEIDKKIKFKIAIKYKEVFKKNFIWNKNFINKNFNRYDVNTALLISIILSKKIKSKYSLITGISVGEYLGLYFSNILNLDETIDLILKRSKILYDQNNINPGHMISVNGINLNEANKIITTNFLKNSVAISLIFSKNFFCISLKKKVFRKVINILNSKKINYMILKNNGPWHSSLILKSKKKVEKLVNSYNYKFNDKLLSNYTGKKHKNLKVLKKNLINQTFNVVRWDKNLEYIKKNCEYYSSPFSIKTVQKLMYFTKCKLKEI